MLCNPCFGIKPKLILFCEYAWYKYISLKSTKIKRKSSWLLFKTKNIPCDRFFFFFYISILSYEQEKKIKSFNVPTGISLYFIWVFYLCNMADRQEIVTKEKCRNPNAPNQQMYHSIFLYIFMSTEDGIWRYIHQRTNKKFNPGIKPM